MSNNKIHPLISIITVNYNQTGVTLELLRSLEQILYKNIEVIVVNNGSNEKISENIKQHYSNIKFIESEKNLGFAGGNNLAIKLAKGKAFLFINNDVEVPKDFLTPMVDRLFGNKKIGIVSPKIKYFYKPTHIQYAGASQINNLTIRNRTIGNNEKDIGQHNTPKETNYAHGACMLVKKEAIEKAGIMDESYFLYYEEIDWCEKIKNKNYTIWYEPLSTVLHKESISTGKRSILKIYYLTRNRLYFSRKNFSKLNYVISLIFFLLISLPKNTITFIVNGEFELLKSFYKGVAWNFNL